MFKSFLNENRCVAICEGYFEWDEKKTPYCFKSKTKDYLLVAAIHSNEDQIMLLTVNSWGN